MMALEYKMRIDFDEDRWFQVEVVADAATPEGYAMEFTMGENPLTVTLAERARILSAAGTAVEAIVRYTAK